MDKKHVSKKEHKDQHHGGRIIFSKEMEALYEKLPTMKQLEKQKKQEEYLKSLSDTERKNYEQASMLAKRMQKKYTFKVGGVKYPPFTFNFRNPKWTITWDSEWLLKATEAMGLSKTITDFILEIGDLSPKTPDGKPSISAEKTYTRK